MEKTAIYRKLDYKNHRLYIITEVFKNGIVQVQRGAINEQINIRQIEPHLKSVEPIP